MMFTPLVMPAERQLSPGGQVVDLSSMQGCGPRRRTLFQALRATASLFPAIAILTLSVTARAELDPTTGRDKGIVGPAIDTRIIPKPPANAGPDIPIGWVFVNPQPPYGTQRTSHRLLVDASTDSYGDRYVNLTGVVKLSKVTHEDHMVLHDT